MPYCRYDKVTGEILSVGTCHPMTLAQRHVTDEVGVLWGAEIGMEKTHRVDPATETIQPNDRVE